MAVPSYVLNVDELQFLTEGTTWAVVDPRYEPPQLISYQLSHSDPAEGRYLQMAVPALATILANIDEEGQLTSTWDYDPADTGTPGRGEINHGDPALLRVASRDNDGTDRTGYLIGVAPGDAIEIASIYFTVTSAATGGSGANTYFDFGVTPETQAAGGLQSVTFSRTATYLAVFPLAGLTGMAWDPQAANRVAQLADDLFPGFRKDTSP